VTDVEVAGIGLRSSADDGLRIDLGNAETLFTNF
jgi:hypothetical protein